MRALLLETDPHAGDAVARKLRTAGHEVLRCHEADLGSFPCVGLSDHACPLEAASGVDVAVVYRAHPYPRPTPYEDGVVCALRHEIPVVVVGTSALNPYEAWHTPIATFKDVVEVCEAAAVAPRPHLGDVASIAARAALLELTGEEAECHATVRRHDGGLIVDVRTPSAAAGLENQVAVKVVSAVRSSDRDAKRIDVDVVAGEPADT